MQLEGFKCYNDKKIILLLSSYKTMKTPQVFYNQSNLLLTSNRNMYVYMHMYLGYSPYSGMSSILLLFLCDLGPLLCPELFFHPDDKLHECSQVGMVMSHDLV